MFLLINENIAVVQYNCSLYEVIINKYISLKKWYWDQKHDT